MTELPEKIQVLTCPCRRWPFFKQSGCGRQDFSRFAVPNDCEAKEVFYVREKEEQNDGIDQC